MAASLTWLDLDTAARERSLRMLAWLYSDKLHRPATVEALASRFSAALRKLLPA